MLPERTSPNVRRVNLGEQHVLQLDCACVGACTILRIQKWDDDPEFYGELYVMPHPWSWSARLRHAWSALTGRYANVPSPCLMEPEARLLGEWLIEQTGGSDAP